MTIGDAFEGTRQQVSGPLSLVQGRHDDGLQVLPSDFVSSGGSGSF